MTLLYCKLITHSELDGDYVVKPVVPNFQTFYALEDVIRVVMNAGHIKTQKNSST